MATQNAVMTAPEIAREIRSRFQMMKELMKKSKIWDSDVELRRRQLRRFQIQLLFKHPFEKEAKDVDTHMWMMTSHSFISAYKAQLAVLDRERVVPTNGRGGPQRKVVEKRKLMQRFKRFLSSEEKFWRSFLINYTSWFSMPEAGIIGQKVSAPIMDSEDSTEAGVERSLFPEGIAVPSEGTDKRQAREHQLAVLAKALVYLGDLARYREQHGEQSRGERTSAHVGGTPRGNQSLSLSSQEFYELSRFLVPDMGNASHQLAILSNYQRDTFTAVYHYYRALCVHHPFETAAENLQTSLNKGFDVFLKSAGKDDPTVSLSADALEKRLKEKAVALHASWRMTDDELRAEQRLHNISSSFIAELSALVSDRNVSQESIMKLLIMAMGALWRARLTSKDNGKRDAKEHTSAERHIARHLLGIFTCLLRIGVLQVSDGQELQENQNDTASGITAVFRRTLPSLRVAGKWIRTHLNYLISLPTQRDVTADTENSLSDFWAAYQSFFSGLLKTFPRSKLPQLKNPLDEDVDLQGFLPLKKAMRPPVVNSNGGLESEQNKVHPNVEYLMRISDLLHDAVEVAKVEKSPIVYMEAQKRFTFKGLAREPVQLELKSSPSKSKNSPPKPTPIPSAPEVLMVPPSVRSQSLLQKSAIPTKLMVKEEPDDDGATVSTRTDDDPVNLAMKASLDSDISDHDIEEDEIVYPKQQLANTPIRSFASVSPRLAAVTPSLSKLSLPGSPITHAIPTPRKLSGYSDVSVRTAVEASWSAAAQPPLLFGSGTGETPSIWSTSLDGAGSALAGKGLGDIKLSPPLHPPTGHAWTSATTQGLPSPTALSLEQPYEKPSSGFRADSPSNFLSSISPHLLPSSLVSASVPAYEPYGGTFSPSNALHPAYPAAAPPPHPAFAASSYMASAVPQTQNTYNQYFHNDSLNRPQYPGGPTHPNYETQKMWAPP